MTSGRRLGSVSLAACVSQGQLQAPSGPVKVTRITPPLPSLVRRPGGSWCACVGRESCLGCPPSPKKLKITDVISLVEEKVLKVLSSIWLLLLTQLAFFSLRA